MNQKANIAAPKAAPATPPPSVDDVVDRFNKGVGIAMEFTPIQEGGYVKDVYKDSKGNLTIGHGHRFIKDPKTGKLRKVQAGDVLSEKDSLALMQEKLREAAIRIRHNVPRAEEMTPQQIASLIDIDYNQGGSWLTARKSPNLFAELSAPGADINEVLSRQIPTYGWSDKGVRARRMRAVNLLIKPHMTPPKYVAQGASASQPVSVVKQASKKDTHGENGEEWTGFDLDGTLAAYDEWKGIDHIGKPVKPMVDLIKKLHREGKPVKIMTARVAPKTFEDGGKGIDFVKDKNGKKKYAFEFIADWCKKNLGFTPPIVHEKDHCMGELYDDRAKQVEQNTGRVLEDSLKEARTCIKGLLKVIGKMAN